MAFGYFFVIAFVGLNVVMVVDLLSKKKSKTSAIHIWEQTRKKPLVGHNFVVTHCWTVFFYGVA